MKQAHLLVFGKNYLIIKKKNYKRVFSRLIFDDESGKSIGYGFAEYKDQETAMSAMKI